MITAFHRDMEMEMEETGEMEGGKQIPASHKVKDGVHLAQGSTFLTLLTFLTFSTLRLSILTSGHCSLFLIVWKLVIGATAPTAATATLLTAGPQPPGCILCCMHRIAFYCVVLHFIARPRADCRCISPACQHLRPVLYRSLKGRPPSPRGSWMCHVSCIMYSVHIMYHV